MSALDPERTTAPSLSALIRLLAEGAGVEPVAIEGMDVHPLMRLAPASWWRCAPRAS